MSSARAVTVAGAAAERRASPAPRAAPARRALDLLLRRRHELTFDRIVFTRERLGARQAANLLLSRLEARRRAPRPWSYPIGLQLEPTIRCQLACPLCPGRRVNAAGAATPAGGAMVAGGAALASTAAPVGTAPAAADPAADPGADPAAEPGAGLMPFAAYERLLAEVGPRLLAIAFWQWGEPLLHPRLPEMVELAARRGILTLCSTNGQTDPEAGRLGDLCAAGLDMLIVSLDGAGEEAYRSFRAGGSLAAARRSLAAAVRARDERGAGRPLVNVRVIATRDSEGEIDGVRALARETGADLFSIKSVSIYDSGDSEHPALPADRRLRSFQYRDREAAAAYAGAPNLCLKPWAWPLLRHDGALHLCECDHALAHPLGNVFAAGSFARVWRGERARALRAAFPADGRVGLDFCRRCRYKNDDAIRRTEALRPVAWARPLPPLSGE